VFELIVINLKIRSISSEPFLTFWPEQDAKFHINNHQICTAYFYNIINNLAGKIANPDPKSMPTPVQTIGAEYAPKLCFIVLLNLKIIFE
jgi:hypothetical protein